MNSSGDVTRCVVLLRPGVLSFNSTCPVVLHCTRERDPQDRSRRTACLGCRAVDPSLQCTSNYLGACTSVRRLAAAFGLNCKYLVERAQLVRRFTC
jgi:hypothetical protein